MTRLNSGLLTAILLAFGLTFATAPVAQTENAKERRDSRDTKQEGRKDARKEKVDCKQASNKSNAECRQGKRDTKQEARKDAREIKY
jgi:hypothetical protein